MKVLLLTIFFLLILVTTANAQRIFTIDFNNTGKSLFYENETVYLSSDVNVTANETLCRVYIVNDNNYWYDGTALSNYFFNKTFYTNSSGYINRTPIWIPPLIIGMYDIVVDTNRDGIFNYSIDCIDNLTATGLEVIPLPRPTIDVSVGDKSPADHTQNVNVNGSETLMFQLKLSAGNFTDIGITNVIIQAGGSGNDVTGVNSVKLIKDDNENGIFDASENILGVDKFDKDNGYIEFNFNKFVITAKNNASFIFICNFNDSADENGSFYFDVIHIKGEGLYSKELAVINGLPIRSATVNLKNVKLEETTTLPTTITTLIPANGTTTTVSESRPTTSLNLNKILIAGIFIAILVVIGLFLVRRRESNL